MKARVAALATAVLTAAGMLTAFTPGPATAQGSFGAFQAYANGTKQHARVVDANGQTVGNVDTSFSSAAANSQGLTPINNVFNEPAVPTTGISGKNSYGRGAAAEVGLGAKFPANQDPQQIILPTLTESAAAPSTPLTVKNLAEIPADPLLYISAATNKTQALWNNDFCPIGQPISYGENDVANAQLINANSSIKMPNAGSQPLVSETPTGDYTTTNFNQSYTYLYPTGPSTFGVGAVNRQVLAPLTVGRGLAGTNLDVANITFLGTWQLRVEDSGNGAPTVTYAAYDTLGNKLPGATPVVTVAIAGMATPLQFTAQQVFGGTGLNVDIPPGPGPYLARIHIGTPPAAIAGMTNGFTTDAVQVTALQVPSQITVADVRYGHMEAQAVAPAGGVSCTIPASKVFTDANGTVTNSLQGGNNFTWKITFPTVDISKELACDLTNVTVTDVATATGAATATITGADHGGKVTSGTVSSTNKGGVTWSLGTYHPGDPPVVLTITGTLGKGAGTLTNTANISATLGNCTGGALGKAFVTNGSIGGKAATIQGTAFNGNATTGAVNVSAAAVLPARLAETGQKEPWLPVVGGGLLLGALALMRSRRRLGEVESSA
ncbi:MAG: LPXTG cell wall anchor domain-containing protein [Acidimicrobiia bacterium]|nr:LPXTG cell wall anchor domain-containing protein [Acidimicrobiia bacterium]